MRDSPAMVIILFWKFIAVGWIDPEGHSDIPQEVAGHNVCVGLPILLNYWLGG